MKNIKVDLHIHTVLSPCATLEMLPPFIVERAIQTHTDLIAITDHNASANVPAVIQAAEGSSQLSIRRPVLESLLLSVPSLADQQRIVALTDLARRERQALHQLIHNREQQLQALAEGLAHAAQAAR